MANGTVKTLTDRGFGFISTEDPREDIFFHSSSLVGVTFEQLQKGDQVTYTAERDPRTNKMRASDVQLVTT